MGVQRQCEPSKLKWLGEVVGKDGEDLSRHDNGCVMYPRLSYCTNFCDDGFFISMMIMNTKLGLVMNGFFWWRNKIATTFGTNQTSHFTDMNNKSKHLN